jgi:hypothetical protein
VRTQAGNSAKGSAKSSQALPASICNGRLEVLAVPDLHLDDQALAQLDEIFPGYRTAPEDYAW